MMRIEVRGWVKKIFSCLFISCLFCLVLGIKSQAGITIFSPEDKVYIFRDTIFIIGKTDAKKLRYWINGREGSVRPREGNFHFLATLNDGLNKIEISQGDIGGLKGDLQVEEKIRLEVFRLKNYKFFVLKTYDSTGPAGFSRYVFHTGEKDAFCEECHAMKPSKAGREMCFSLCHKNDIMKWGYMHGPAGEGACLACHDSEGSDNGYKVVVDGGGQICMTCHEGIGSMKKNVHTAVEKQFCMGCHSPHGTINDFVLWEDGRAKMCDLCHMDKKNKMIRYPHKAIPDGDCLGCHHPHESDNPYSLRQSAGQLCVETECHGRITGAISKHLHPYDVRPTKGSPVAIPEDIFLDDKKNVVCYSCHNPHGSDNPFIFWMPKEKLCPSCHSNLLPPPLEKGD
ncbi:MAG: cytochrome c3 family protein [bacterium]